MIAPLLTRQEVATILNVKIRTVDKLIKRGDLPARRVSDRKVAVSEDDLRAFLDGRLVVDQPAQAVQPAQPSTQAVQQPTVRRRAVPFA